MIQDKDVMKMWSEEALRKLIREYVRTDPEILALVREEVEKMRQEAAQ